MSGGLGRQAKKTLLSSYLYPESKLYDFKWVFLLALVNVLYTSLMGLLSSTGAMNYMLVDVVRDGSLVFFAYWMSTYVYLLTLVIAFSLSYRWAVSIPSFIINCLFRSLWAPASVVHQFFGTSSTWFCSWQIMSLLIWQLRSIQDSHMQCKSI